MARTDPTYVGWSDENDAVFVLLLFSFLLFPLSHASNLHPNPFTTQSAVLLPIRTSVSDERLIVLSGRSFFPPEDVSLRRRISTAPLRRPSSPGFSLLDRQRRWNWGSEKILTTNIPSG